MTTQDNEQQQREESSPLDNFSFLRVFGAVAFGLGAIMILVATFRGMDMGTTYRTHSNGYQTTTEMEGPFGKSKCVTTTVGGSSVTRCD